MTEQDKAAAVEWLQSGWVGTSSETIYRTLMGESIRRADIPYDPDDFSRCYRLLQCVPAFRPRLGEVGQKYPEWVPFVEAWDELTALYEEGCRLGWPKPYPMYERMKALRPSGL